MPTIIRLLRLLAIIVWVGGIIFFAFVLAPVAFSLLPSPHVAGIVAGGTLRVLDILGLCCGGIFWIATAILFRQSDKAFKGRYEAQILLASIMLLANRVPAIQRASRDGERPPTGRRQYRSRISDRRQQVQPSSGFTSARNTPKEPC